MPSSLPRLQPGPVNRLSERTETTLAATPDTRPVAPDTREPRAGDFTGPGCAGVSYVWREGEKGERRCHWKKADRGLQSDAGDRPAFQKPEDPGLVSPLTSQPRFVKINQVDKMAVWCAPACAPPSHPPRFLRHQPFSCMLALG